MLKPLLQNSKFVLLLKIFWKKCYYLNGWIYNLYKNNHTCNREINEIKGENNLLILDNSKFIRWLFGMCRGYKEMAISCLHTSISVNLIEKLKKEIYFSPIKIISIILISLILINIFFSIIFNQEIKLLGWIIRVLFLFVGLGGLFCKVNLEDIKRTSFILSHINK